MGNRKPRSEIDRLPADFEDQRQHQMSPTSKLSADLGPLLHTTPETRSDAVRAVAFVHAKTPETPETIGAAGLLLDVLGLLPRKPVVAVQPGSLAVPCPQCGKPVGVPCETDGGGRYQRGHRGRSRRAQEKREAAA